MTFKSTLRANSNDVSEIQKADFDLLDKINVIGASLNSIQNSNVLNGFRVWESNINYTIDDPVFRFGVPYKALTSNINKAPESNPSDWQLQGADQSVKITGDQTVAGNKTWTGTNRFNTTALIVREGNVAALEATSYRDSASRAYLNGRGSRGTEASPLPLSAGDRIVTLLGSPRAPSGFATETGSVRIIANQDITDTAYGTRIDLVVTPDSATANLVGAQIPSAGIYNTTTATGANVVITTGNQLQRSVSSKRFKQSIEDIDIDIAQKIIDKVRLIWYRSKCVADNNMWSYYGVLAEELAEIDPRLCTWGYWPDDYEEVVTFVDEEEYYEDEDGDIKKRIVKVKNSTIELKKGAELSPTGVQYDRLAMIAIKVQQADRERIKSMEERLERLEKVALSGDIKE